MIVRAIKHLDSASPADNRWIKCAKPVCAKEYQNAPVKSSKVVYFLDECIYCNFVFVMALGSITIASQRITLINN